MRKPEGNIHFIDSTMSIGVRESEPGHGPGEFAMHKSQLVASRPAAPGLGPQRRPRRPDARTRQTAKCGALIVAANQKPFFTRWVIPSGQSGKPARERGYRPAQGVDHTSTPTGQAAAPVVVSDRTATDANIRVRWGRGGVGLGWAGRGRVGSVGVGLGGAALN